MATLQTSGNINKVFTVSFIYKNSDVEILVNDNGTHCEMRVNNEIKYDFYGEAFNWKSTYGLHGAALKMATISQLRKHAIYLIENPLENDE